jgi:hypothetical protein
LGSLTGVAAAAVLVALSFGTIVAGVSMAARPSLVGTEAARPSPTAFAALLAPAASPLSTAAAGTAMPHATLTPTLAPTPTPLPTPRTQSPTAWPVRTVSPTPTPPPSFEPAVGSQARLRLLDASAKLVPVGRTTDDLDAFEKAQFAKDTVGIQQMRLLGRTSAVPDGTTVLVIDLKCTGFLCTTSAYQVRILEGDYARAAGFVRRDYLGAP